MLSKSKTQTQKFAARLVNKILKARRPEQSRRATIIALHGDLGAGKTTFVQGFMKALEVKHRVTSPTFLIIRKYEISTPLKKNRPHYHHAYHLDLYRIHKPKELLDLGFKKTLQDPHAIVLIEWPERIKKLLPKNTIWINFEHGKNEKERIIRVKHKT
ncbi:MAG: tRNA (adenosine(37)-N6)-threonylcarbamoyltransferase complex ATPase subunit type 1 TsaE [Candidatus Harrisonbacteria bacterium]|nr:tRNA (adenosine(37)-N6)-threonylcarbamoyltransferase complex ATPase subunit type 1 TsaE [Candidatus Harrisonbacteria bacterium]